MMRKVIFVTREGYDLAGARIRCYNFARELRSRGIKAEVLSYACNLGAKDGMHEGSMGALERLKYNIAAYKSLCMEKDAVIVLQRVNYHSFGPLASRIIKKNRLVLDMDDWEIRDDPGYILGFYPTSKAEWLTRRIASMSNFCVAASFYLKDYLRQFNRNVYYVPSCVDADLFKPGRKNGERNIVKLAWTGTLHRITDVENVKFIIDCFMELRGRIKDVSLDITGDGIYSKEISSYVRDHTLGDYVNLVGWVHPDRMPSYLDSIDIGLFPLIQSTRFNLSKSPAKLFEYMAMGKAVVSSCIGEAERIIGDGRDGFLARNKDDFVGRMEILCRDAKLREEMGRNARTRVVADYTLGLAGERLVAIFRDLLCR